MRNIFGHRRTPETAQPIYPGAQCHVQVGEAHEDERTGREQRRICGAVATIAWPTRERSVDDETDDAMTVVIPLCAAHEAQWRAAVMRCGSLEREVHPAGAFARWNADASEQAQEILDTVIATVTERLYRDHHASEAQVHALWQACEAAIEDLRNGVVLKPVVSLTQPPQSGNETSAHPHKPVQLV